MDLNCLITYQMNMLQYILWRIQLIFLVDWYRIMKMHKNCFKIKMSQQHRLRHYHMLFLKKEFFLNNLLKQNILYFFFQQLLMFLKEENLQRSNISSQVSIRSANLQLLKKYVPTWLQPLNWQIGLNDPELFFSIDPDGFFMAFKGEEAIGNIHAVTIDLQRKQGFIGYFYVKPEQRRKKYGERLFDQALKYLDGVNIGLCSVLDKVGFYESKGFKSYYSIFTYHLTNKNILLKEQQPINIVYLKDVKIQYVKQYEAKCGFNYPEIFTKKWICQQGGLSLAFVQNEKIKGIAVLRPTTKMYRVGPLLADKKYIAKCLLQSLMRQSDKDKKICISVCENNDDGVNIMKQLGGNLVTQLKIMYNKHFPEQMKSEKTYARHGLGI